MFIRLLIISFITVLSCTNPFSTRDPESPDTQDDIEGFEPARTSQDLLLNFEKAIEEKNVAEYSNCFADVRLGHEISYRFEPDVNLIDYFLDFWTRQDEENYFKNVTAEERQNYPKLTFTTLDDPAPRPINLSAPDDSVETEIYRYQLSIRRIDTLQVYSGQMKLRMFKSPTTEFWYIYRWYDYAIDEKIEQTWSFLKSENR